MTIERIGASPRRREDVRFVTGQSAYLDDLTFEQLAHAVVLRSPHAHALIRSIDADLEAGHAAVIQIVSTGEALMERRLAEIPTEEWNDLTVDVTPREYVLSGVPDKT